MSLNPTLRARVILGTAAIGCVLSLILGAVLFAAHEQVEHNIIGDVLHGELEELRRSQTAELPSSEMTQLMGLYQVPPGDEQTLPVWLRGLEDGVHEMHLEGREIHVLVEHRTDRTLIASLDTTSAEEGEGLLMLILLFTVLGAAYASIWLGFAMSRRVIAPVSELAETVTHLPADDLSPIDGSAYPPDEVGDLVEAFNGYRRRLADMVHREQAFTSDVSHELRTPLTVISGTVELLLKDAPDDGRERQRLQRVQRAAHEMQAMVEAFIALARESQGEAREDAVAAETFLEGLASDHRHIAETKPVELVVEAPDDLRLPGPAPALAVVVGNLLRNALAYTERGRVTLQASEGRVTIRDTGPGLSEERQRELFTRRADSAQGTGLGLAITRRICEHYGWSLDVDSAPGEGSVFTVRFGP